ncbi:MAG: RNA polymerase subunit sigma-70 [Planctomycetes bacterium]|nr:RNA polymerase subunit sigma-70 [Planctomycetota bacterium]
MTDPQDPRITLLLQRMEAGDESAGAALAPLVHAELRRLAGDLMRGQPAGHTLQATALVNEAWIRLAGDGDVAWRDHRHFFRVAAKAMRSILVDHARRKAALKRAGAGERVPLDDAIEAYEKRSIDLVAVDEALERLAAVDGDLVRLVELRFFAGLSIPETARVLDVSTPTIERGWRTARAILQLQLSGEELG